MKDYKLKQVYFHKLGKFDDDLSMIDHQVQEMNPEQIIDYCKKYFSEEVDTIFPAKSYAVAIIYAKLIEEKFNEVFLDCLDDPDLFLDTDKFFIPYKKDKFVYDKICEFLTQNDLWDFEKSDLYNVKKTVSYFEEEFLWE